MSYDPRQMITIHMGAGTEMRKTAKYALLFAPFVAFAGVSGVSSQVVTGTQDFSITVQESIDATPDAFSFSSTSGLEPGVVTESAAVTITGISGDIPISVSGGEYSISGGAYTATAGVITNGQTVRLRVTSSASWSGSASSTVTIGTASGTFTALTRDAGPCDLPGISVGTSCGDGTVYVGDYDSKRYFMTTSRTATATWSDSNTNMRSATSSTSGWTNTQGMRASSPTLSFFNGAQYCANTIGSDFFLPSTNEINEIWNNLSTVQRSIYFVLNSFHMTSEQWGTGKFGQSSSTTNNFYYVIIPRNSFTSIDWTGRGKTYAAVVKCVRTDTNIIADDFDPDAFSFAAQTNVAPSTAATSNVVTISGIVGNAPISISGVGASFSVDGGAFSSASRTVTDGQTVQVRLSSSAAPSASVTASLTVGSLTRPFSVTTSAADTTPDAFAFTSQSDVQPSTEITSNSVTIAGLVGPAPVSVSGGASYSINGGAFTAAAGSVSNGETLRVRMTSSATLGGSVTGSVTVGTVTETFGLTTTSQDTTPDAFAFSTSENRTSAQPNTLVTFNPVTVSGLSASVPVTVSGTGSPAIRINGGSWVTSGTVSNGDTVAVRLTSSSLFSGSRSATVTVGEGTASVSVFTRAADAAPNAFTVSALTGQEPSSTVTSTPVTPTGYEQATLVPGAGLSVSVNGGAFSASAQTVTAGQSITLRATSPVVSGSSSFSLGFRNASGTTVYTASWSVSSRGPNGPSNPNFAWTYQTCTTSTGCTSTSETITLSGSFSNARVLFGDVDTVKSTPSSSTAGWSGTNMDWPSVSINGGAFLDRYDLQTTSRTVNPGDTLRIQFKSGSRYVYNLGASLNVGETSLWRCWSNATYVSPDPRPVGGRSTSSCQ